MQMRPDEAKLVDVTAPYRSLIWPALELILITGICWIAIGWMDTHGLPYRNAVVVAWGVLSAWRFLLPLWRARRRRFIVTTTRVIARTGSQVDSIPLTDIAGVRRRRGGISLAIKGYGQPLYFPELPKTKKIARIIGEELGGWR